MNGERKHLRMASLCPDAGQEEEISIYPEVEILPDAEAEAREYFNEQRKAQDEWDREELKERCERADSDIWPARRATTFFVEPRIPIKAYVPGFVYAGSINALIGAAKAGKSTLTWSMLDCAMRGVKFLGQPCAPSRVLYISEQSSVSFRAQMSERLPEELFNRIASNGKFMLALPEHHKRHDEEGKEIPATSWEARLKVWEQLVANPLVEPDIVVLDTFNAYADFQFGGENDNGLMAKRLFDLNKLRAIKPSLAILILHHVTKSAETSGITYLPLSAIRGGSAFAAGVDHAVTLNKKDIKDSPQSRIRYCYTQSRMTDEHKFDVEWLADGGYREIPEGAVAARKQDKNDRELAKFKSISDANPEAGVRELAGLMGCSKTKAAELKKRLSSPSASVLPIQTATDNGSLMT
jgi:RecA-family ATPase